jgi:hypothetical protein
LFARILMNSARLYLWMGRAGQSIRDGRLRLDSFHSPLRRVQMRCIILVNGNRYFVGFDPKFGNDNYHRNKDRAMIYEESTECVDNVINDLKNYHGVKDIKKVYID